MEDKRIAELIEIIPRVIQGRTFKPKQARMKCYCGNEFIISVYRLYNLNYKSCGCYFKEIRSTQKPNTKDGNRNIYDKSFPYSVYMGIRQRCLNKNNVNYKHYGGRGITICKEWLDDYSSFYKWCIDNKWKRGLHIDRRDNNLGYSPDNCRIVKTRENANNRRCTIMIEYNGQKKALSYWAEDLGIDYKILYSRIFVDELSIEEAFDITKNKIKTMSADKSLGKIIKEFLKSEGRTQRWLFLKLVDKGILIDETRISNKLNNIVAFTIEEIDSIVDLLQIDKEALLSNKEAVSISSND